jgi:hypothetical protein
MPIPVAWVSLELSYTDAQRLYEHLGTMPYAPGSWSHVIRAELSDALHEAQHKDV